MNNQSLTELVSELASMKQSQRDLERRLQEQQSELATLRKTLARKNHPAFTPPASIVPTTLPPVPTHQPNHAQKPDPTRRKMLKRMGLAVLAGGAALGVTATTFTPAEARISLNPTSKIGAVITRNGGSITNIPAANNYGLITSVDDSLDISTIPFFPIVLNVGISGFGSPANSSIGVFGFGRTGVYGYSTTGNGLTAHSDSGYGVYGASSDGIGVNGVTSSTFYPGVNAAYFGPEGGVAFRIEEGGLSIKGAGMGTHTAAFIHHTTSGNITGDYSVIDNPFCNARPDALLFVTHNFTPPSPPVGGAGVRESQVFGVSYRSNISKWTIFNEDASGMNVNEYFNVLIINP